MNTALMPSDSVILLLKAVDESQSRRLAYLLGSYNIFTIEQLYGALNPYLPALEQKEIKTKGLRLNYTSLRIEAKSITHKLRRLQDSLFISQTKAERIVDGLGKIAFPTPTLRKNPSALSIGYSVPLKRMRTSYWSSVKLIKQLPSSLIIPGYTRVGAIFDQGKRGTCVANAATSLIDYISGKRTSRQFLYHQCKMLDGSPGSEGTYIETAIKALEDENILDYGSVLEKEWPYSMEPKGTIHQGPPPEHCYYTNRYRGIQPIFIRLDSVVTDIKNLLNGGEGYSPSPVIVGLNIFESFQNYYSNRTGWINMPLPGEALLGGHAMLVVGYYDKEKLFLVRNSWGSIWAEENLKGYPGHALIPYQYFDKYCGSGATILQTVQKSLNIEPNNRLYNKNHAGVKNSATKFSLLYRKLRRRNKKSIGAKIKTLSETH